MHHYRNNPKVLSGEHSGLVADGYEKQITGQDVKNTIRHQLDKNHRNVTFMQCLEKMSVALQAVENEKERCVGF